MIVISVMLGVLALLLWRAWVGASLLGFVGVSRVGAALVGLVLLALPLWLSLLMVYAVGVDRVTRWMLDRREVLRATYARRVELGKGDALCMA